MSKNTDLGNGGRKIVPSARKSIHSHTYSYVLTKPAEMVRYGKASSEESSEDETSGPSARGTDEVDNIISKPQHTSSPILTKENRRHSITPPHQIYSERPYVNELKAREIENSPISKGLNWTLESAASPRSTSRSTDSRNSSHSSQSPNLSRLNQSNHINEENKSRVVLFYLIPIVMIVAALAFYCQQSTLAINDVYDELRFHTDLNELGAKYKVGGNSILKIQTGISTIYKREDTTGCLIFVYNSMSENFDPIKFDGFVNNVASKAAKFLRNDNVSVQYLVVEGSDLKMQSHSQLVKAYREDMAKTGVLLIRDVEHVPSPLAMAFHYYCDEFNPLVKKSAVFFTLNSAKCHNSDEKSSHATVEKCLKEKWSTIPKDNIGPLLTRVVSIVVDVTSGF
ncbi:uncharacterized protein isoform X2 [Choristoneura fumiferana]|uniref:uncharacterized protein isoform X2 n=1 Tax=Choristoneura fumiferana TaxID=7141 RepID=UPI003D15C5FD